MKYKRYKLSDITENYDKKRVPLSAMQRAQRNGNYRYFGAQGVIDYIDDYLFDGNYILIAEDGENLKSKKQNIASYVSGKFWVNNHAHILQTNDLCDLRYLYYLINSMDISAYITGSAQPKLSQSNLNAIEVDLPDITNQKKIVSIMKLLDEKIELNNKINNHLAPHLCEAQIAARRRRRTPQPDGGLHTDEKVSGRGTNEETAEQFSSQLAA